MKKVSIEQIEPQVAQQIENPLKAALKQLGYPIPSGFRLRVSLLQANGDKKRKNAAAGTWAPEKSEPGKFWLEPADEQENVAAAENPKITADPPVSKSINNNEEMPQRLADSGIAAHPAEVKLLRALDRAESTPGWNFVSLKRFRDDILPTEPLAPGESALTDVNWQEVISTAIDKRLILTGKVLNPKSPQFPTTSIRLNRMLPAVQQILGQPKKNLGFRPIHIKGEPLSATILRERR